MFPGDAGRDDGPVESFAVTTAEVRIRPPIGVRSTLGRGMSFVVEMVA